MSELLSIDEALALVLERAKPLEAETVLVADAGGRVLADDVRAAVDLPPFRSSAMDGFAVRSLDTPGTLPIAARVVAGSPAERALEPGEAMAIATGGAVPEGADAVVPIELVRESDGNLLVETAVEADKNVRAQGGEVKAGEIVLPAGARLGPAQVGALAAAGLPAVRCARKPRAVVLSTGTELCEANAELGPGQIYESNGTMLAAALAACDLEVERLDPIADDRDLHRETLECALTADMLVSSGGVSVGPHDLFRGIAAELGVTEVFWRTAVRPGKPVYFGVRGQTLVFGLPGNPVAALVGFELFVRPALRALQGARETGPDYLIGRLGSPVRATRERDGLTRALACVKNGTVVLEPLPGKDSHMIVRSATANALVLVPRGEDTLPAGAEIRYLPLS